MLKSKFDVLARLFFGVVGVLIIYLLSFDLFFLFFYGEVVNNDFFFKKPMRLLLISLMLLFNFIIYNIQLFKFEDGLKI